MKKLITVFALAALCVVFALGSVACKGSDKPANDVPSAVTTKSPAEIYNAVAAVAKFDGMTVVPTRDYTDIYGIDPAKVDSSVWYMSENPSLNADEVAIFKLSDETYAEQLSKLFKDRIARQLQVAETYSPAEASKLENAEVVVNGSWVYYCVGAEAEAMMKVLRSEIK